MHMRVDNARSSEFNISCHILKTICFEIDIINSLPIYESVHNHIYDISEEKSCSIT